MLLMKTAKIANLNQILDKSLLPMRRLLFWHCI